jgi:hypothetical protein
MIGIFRVDRLMSSLQHLIANNRSWAAGSKRAIRDSSHA